MKFNLQRFAESWADVPVANVKFDVALNADGNIAKDGETAASQKSFTMKGFSVTGTPAQANTVLDKVIGDISGGTYASGSKVRTIVQGVTGTPD